MSTKVCLIVQVSFTANSETLPCSGGYDIASMTGAHNWRNSMTGNSFTVDSETICDTVVCVCVFRESGNTPQALSLLTVKLFSTLWCPGVNRESGYSEFYSLEEALKN